MKDANPLKADQTKSEKKNLRSLEGVVSSTGMEKTISVLVGRKVTHPTYKKQYSVSKKYLVHDEKGEAKVGDKVSFAECRPLSKNKRWRLISVIK